MTSAGFYLYGAICFLMGWVCHMIFKECDKRQEQRKEEPDDDN